MVDACGGHHRRASAVVLLIVQEVKQAIVHSDVGLTELVIITGHDAHSLLMDGCVLDVVFS